MDPTSVVLPLVAGVSLAAVAGLRAFLPLFVAGLAGRLGWIPLSGQFEWLASTTALIGFGSATVFEVLADKVPVVDHILDVVGLVVKPVAGAVAVAALAHRLDPFWAAVLGILAGGAVAGAVHVAKAKTRVGSTLATLGHANPLLSVVEDGVSLGGSLLAVLWPVVAVLFLALAAAAAWLVFRLVRRAFRGAAATPAPRAR